MLIDFLYIFITQNPFVLYQFYIHAYRTALFLYLHFTWFYIIIHGKSFHTARRVAAEQTGTGCSMGRFAFICDFDGTISTTDFYIQVLRSRMPQREADTIAALRSGKHNDFDILNEVFSGMNVSADGLAAEIKRIPVDAAFPALVSEVERAGGDFIILSAGCAYYIGEVLQRYGLAHIERYGNPGVYNEAARGLMMHRAKDAPYYSERYGVDKAAAVRLLQARYDVMFYAGDSLPDVDAGLLCHTRFAKGSLARIYRERGAEHVAINGLGDILPHLHTLL